jgi:hypothetical protein
LVDGLVAHPLIPNRRDIFLYFTAFRLALVTPIQWVPGTLFMGRKWLGHEADLSPSTANVKNGGAMPLFPQTSSWCGVQFIKHRDAYTFYILLFI